MLLSHRESEFKSLFHEFVDTYFRDDVHHLAAYESGRRSARENYELILRSEKAGEDITDLVLLKLLPHTNSPHHREIGAWISIAPAITKDIRSWYEGAKWTKPEDWPFIATAIFDFVKSAISSPSGIADHVSQFLAHPTSKGFQAGVLSPILNALDPDSFLIKNKKSRVTTNYFGGFNCKPGLGDYAYSNNAEMRLVEALAPLMAVSGGAHSRPSDVFDMFTHWLYAVKKYPGVRGTRVRTEKGEVVVSIPTPEKDETKEADLVVLPRESYVQQARLAELGARMGYRVWIPRSDRGAVLSQVSPLRHSSFLDQLPLNYDDATIRTIEQIDVIWMKGRSMARAFEVEHTTAVYSGLLRMADLLALQPNMDIRLHIVAPEERRGKVRDEILRPVFNLLDKPLSRMCTYISYDMLQQLTQLQHIEHLSDSVLDTYAEAFEEELEEV